MKEKLTTLEPVTTHADVRQILNKEGFVGAILSLEPGEETRRIESSEVEDHVLFVIDGEVTVRFDDVNTILGRDEALLVPKGKAHALAAGGERRARLLRLEVPPRQIVTPQILSFD